MNYQLFISLQFKTKLFMKTLYHTLLSILLITVVNHGNSQEVFAHRGGASLAPENTLLAFQTAIDLHVDYFELDIRVSSDNYIMILMIFQIL